jgi:hypothetical protein
MSQANGLILTESDRSARHCSEAPTRSGRKAGPGSSADIPKEVKEKKRRSCILQLKMTS